MPQITGTKRTDGLPVAIEATDDGALYLEIDSDSVTALREFVDVLNGVARVEEQNAHEYVAAGSTTQALGATDGIGDYLYGLLIIPAVVACGAVSLKDGSGTDRNIFIGGGTTALTDCKPFFIPVRAISQLGAWQVTTGANVAVIGVGRFTA